MSATAPTGLSSNEAALRLARDGANELPSAKPRTPWAIALEVVREPILLLLIGAAAVYLLLGDLREALVLFASVFVVLAITFYQQRKTERALEALRELASPRAQVLRDGEWRSIPGREVVVGDLVRLKEGDRVPADALLLDATHLMADESLLTGESVPVGKRPADHGPVSARPGGDDLPMIYSGTLLTRGRGIARVTAIGVGTEIGKIGKALQILQREPTSIERETRRAVVVFAAVGVALCVVVTVLYGVTRKDWLNGLLAGITLAMANIPEEIPVVLTVFLALGAWRIAQHDVLTRRPPAIEMLGAATVLCVDKTGTLTRNRMAVRRIWAADSTFDLQRFDGPIPPPVIECSLLASEREAFDPMERAYHELVLERSPETVEKLETRMLVHAYPLSPGQLTVAYVWRIPGSDDLVVACKGAPEAVADLCVPTPAERARMDAQVESMARDGLRVLGLARGTLADRQTQAWPPSQRELGLEFVALTGLADPIRPTVPTALTECYEAGIRTVMITGDYPGTAQAIARQIGLQRADAVISGRQIDALDDASLRRRVAEADIFARVVPEQKLRLVQAFKANGEIVAMTGDGVNDAPALKAAHIGVAMGQRGSDVAREAAALVLLRDDFTSLVQAIALGRRIYDNIKKAIGYIIAVHIPTAGVALLPLLFGWPLVLYPVHVMFLEFVIDPACSIAFEAEPAERDVMRRPPRPATARLFDAWTLAISALQGASVLVAVALLYALALAHATPEREARALAFAAIVIGNLGLIVTNRSRNTDLVEIFSRPNAALWWLVAGALAGLALTLYVAPLQEIFRFAPLGASQLLAAAVAPLLSIAWLELYKRFRARRGLLRES